MDSSWINFICSSLKPVVPITKGIFVVLNSCKLFIKDSGLEKSITTSISLEDFSVTTEIASSFRDSSSIALPIFPEAPLIKIWSIFIL